MTIELSERGDTLGERDGALRGRDMQVFDDRRETEKWFTAA